MNNKIRRFEDLIIWKEGMRITCDIYQIMEHSSKFKLKDQMESSSLSVPSNIAEGYERNSHKEFIRFLRIAKGSTGELRTQLYICMQLKVIEKEKCKTLIRRTKRLSGMIQNFINNKDNNSL